MARRRKRRRLNVGRIVGLVVIIAVIAVGAFFITTRLGRTSMHLLINPWENTW